MSEFCHIHSIDKHWVEMRDKDRGDWCTWYIGPLGRSKHTTHESTPINLLSSLSLLSAKTSTLILFDAGPKSSSLLSRGKAGPSRDSVMAMIKSMIGNNLFIKNSQKYSPFNRVSTLLPPNKNYYSQLK